MKTEEPKESLQEFLEKYNPEEYDRLSVTVDILVFATDEKRTCLQVLLVKRKDHPYIGEWALPGGFMNIDESAYLAACRKLEEKTGLTNIYMEQLYTFTNPKRDPRMRIIDIAYMALLPTLPKLEDDNMRETAWFIVNISKDELILTHEDTILRYRLAERAFDNGKVGIKGIVPERQTEIGLAFDHAEILYEGIVSLQNKMLYSDLFFNLLPDEFSCLDIKALYELIMNEKIHPQKVRRMYSRFIEQTESVKETEGRPQLLYKIKKGD